MCKRCNYLYIILGLIPFWINASHKHPRSVPAYVLHQRVVTTQYTLKKTQAQLSKALKELKMLNKTLRTQSATLKKARRATKKKIQTTIHHTKKRIAQKQKNIKVLKKAVAHNLRRHLQAKNQLATAHTRAKKVTKKSAQPHRARRKPIPQITHTPPASITSAPRHPTATANLHRLDICGGTAQILDGYAPIANDAACAACFNGTITSLLCLWCTANVPGWAHTVRTLTPLEHAILDNLEPLLDQCAKNYAHIERNHALWVGNTPAGHQRHYQKLVVPPATHVFLWGDIHGGGLTLIESLIYLQKNNVIDLDLHVAKNNFLVFTGDYTDRGSRNLLTLYTLLYLAAHNPDRAILLRGNHEQTLEGWAALPGELAATGYGSLLAKVQRFQYQMPIILFLGAPAADNSVRFWQIQHAAVDIGIDARALLADNRSRAYATLNLQRHAIANQLQPALQARAPHKRLTDNPAHLATTSQEMLNLDSLWSDFPTTRDIPYATHPMTRFHMNNQAGRGPFYSKDLSLMLLDYQTRGLAHSIVGTIHGHQYHGQLRNTARTQVPGALWSWDNRLITLLANDEWLETHGWQLHTFYSSFLELVADHSPTGWRATRVLLRCSDSGIGSAWHMQKTPGPINAPPGAVDYTDL